MNGEQFSVGDIEKKIFIQYGFFYHKKNRIKSLSPLHRHHYAEIHMITEGKMVIWIENTNYTLCPGDALLIPAKTYHNILDFDENTVHSAFQVDAQCSEVVQKSMPLAVLKEFFNEIKLTDTEKNYVKVLAYILLVCANLIDSLNYGMPKLQSDALRISNFFENRYHEDIHVSDLAKELHASERQVQLLVKRITGKTFRQVLSEHRMKVANYLKEHTDMSMAEIASKVGFCSYSGFWKVYKEYNKEKNKD